MPRLYRYTAIATSDLPILENPNLSDMRSEFGQRLFEARKHAKLTQTQLALAVGMSQGTYGELERIGQGSSYTPAIAEKCGVDVNWLAYGNGQMVKNAGNLDAARAFTGEVPVISWVQAGAWQDMCDTFQPGEAERYLPIFRGHSSKTFALKVRGDSMTAPHGKSYPQGSYIIVDPEKRSPMNGDRIIAMTPGSTEATFKVYKDEDGRRWLSPLNTTHPTIQEPFEVLGTVIGKWEDE